jgi:spermidine synthase
MSRAVDSSALKPLPYWQDLQQVADGTLFFEPAGVHFVRVEKTGNRVDVILLDQTTLTSQLVQSTIDVSSPERLAADSTQAMCLPLTWTPNPQHIYLAGLGGGSLAYGLHRYLPTTYLDCLEIEPVLVQIAQDLLGLKSDQYLQIFVEDGRQYLTHRHPAHLYDLMVIDVFLGNGYTPYAMATQAFFELCQKHLLPQGTLVINFLAADPWYAHKVHTLRQVFPHLACCALPQGNQVVFARSMPIPVQGADRQAESWLHQTVKPWLGCLQPVPICHHLGDADVLQDASPPSDYFNQLPAFNTLFAKVASEAPCPCGSGQPYRLCHAARESL